MKIRSDDDFISWWNRLTPAEKQTVRERSEAIHRYFRAARRAVMWGAGHDLLAKYYPTLRMRGEVSFRINYKEDSMKVYES